ncbi:glycoside hydrolase family 65 protein [soil metagenome]
MTSWHLIEDRFIPALAPAHESLFSIGNGYLSTRGSFEESLTGEVRASFIQGLFVNPPGELPLLGAIPDWTGVTISIDGTPFNLDRRPAGYQRSLDFRTGVVEREVLWRGAESGVMKLRFRRLVSMADPHLAALELTISALTSRAVVRLETGLDAGVPSPITPAWNPTRWSRPNPNQIKLVAESIDGAHTLDVEAVLYGGPIDYFIADHRHHRLVTERTLRAGESISYTKFVTFHSSRDRGRRSDLPAPNTPFDVVASASHRAWKRRWISSNVEIDGDPEAERALRFAAFQLIGAAAPKDAGAAIGAKLASGFGYRHHVFWDTDLFVVPYFTVTQPDLARSHLAYRFQGLDGARRKAKRFGREGAFYAWESAGTGDEVTPEWTTPVHGLPIRIWTGELEEHITSDVAYAAHHYWLWSGDDRFMADQGVEIVAEGARYWASRFELDSAGAHLSNVIGPDEYHTHVTDSFFTNIAASWQLRTAATLVEWLRKSAPRKASALSARLGLTNETLSAWQQLAGKVVLHRDGNEVWEQHAGFFELEEVDIASFFPRQAAMYDLLGEEQIEKVQVLKQADVVMAMALFPELIGSRQVRQRTWDYYLARTDHGSSLSPAVHSRVASDLGLRDLSYELFRRALAVDLEDSMGNSRDGLHAATQGGALQAAIFGFGGLHIAKGQPATAARLPDHWKSFGFSSFHRGQRQEWELGQADKSARARSTKTKGKGK